MVRIVRIVETLFSLFECVVFCSCARVLPIVGCLKKCLLLCRIAGTFVLVKVLLIVGTRVPTCTSIVTLWVGALCVTNLFVYVVIVCVLVALLGRLMIAGVGLVLDRFCSRGAFGVVVAIMWPVKLMTGLASWQACMS